MKNKKQEKAKEEYYLGTNEKNEKIIRKVNLETNQEINIIFDTSENTDVMSNVIKELTKYYIEDLLQVQM
mgnify:FL=1